jgi:Rad3-related DNA helicase
MAAAASGISRRADRGDGPNMLLAEAGTGIGKTLAYLAPASCGRNDRAERSGSRPSPRRFSGSSTRKGPKLVAEPAERARRIVIRKGRENYLCLLNLEDALQGGFAGRPAILAQLVGRWAAYTRDGDMVGGDLPGWLPSLFRRAGSTALTDRRGEMRLRRLPTLSPLLHRARRAAGRQADLVIANHALVMINAARARESAPQHIVFDEGHHLFDAADSTFAVALSGQEAIEMRRWIVGPEGRSRGRRRGLAARLMDVASYDDEGGAALEQAIEAARRSRPTAGWAGSPKALRSGRSKPCSPRSAGRFTRAPRRRTPAMGSKPSLPSLTERWSLRQRRRWRRWKRCKSRCRCSRAGSKHSSRTRPTGSIRRRGRGSKARSTGCPGGARPCPPGAPCWPGSAGRPTRFRRLAGGRPGRRPRI